jgi:hypothetical protein
MHMSRDPPMSIVFIILVVFVAMNLALFCIVHHGG